MGVSRDTLDYGGRDAWVTRTLYENRQCPVLTFQGRVWFTSDTHYWHDNIIKPEYCDRPYFSVEQMNADMIGKWNARVAPDDVVFHLGDFSFGGTAKMQAIVPQLQGHKVLIRGNHDHKVSDAIFTAAGFERVERQAIYEVTKDNKVTDERYYLAHVPQARSEWPRVAAGCNRQLCGHVHEKWKQATLVRNPDPEAKWPWYQKVTVPSERFPWPTGPMAPMVRPGECVNMGVDVRNFEPVLLEEALDGDVLPRPRSSKESGVPILR